LNKEADMRVKFYVTITWFREAGGKSGVLFSFGAQDDAAMRKKYALPAGCSTQTSTADFSLGILAHATLTSLLGLLNAAFVETTAAGFLEKFTRSAPWWWK
jgi:hypothetical protein